MLISFSLKKVTLKVITAIGQLRFELTLTKGNGQTQKETTPNYTDSRTNARQQHSSRVAVESEALRPMPSGQGITKVIN